jgi:hypothetical protein
MGKSGLEKFLNVSELAGGMVHVVQVQGGWSCYAIVKSSMLLRRAIKTGRDIGLRLHPFPSLICDHTITVVKLGVNLSRKSLMKLP